MAVHLYPVLYVWCYRIFFSPYLTDLGLSSPDPSRLLPGHFCILFCGCSSTVCTQPTLCQLVRGYRLWTLTSSPVVDSVPVSVGCTCLLKDGVLCITPRSGLPHGLVACLRLWTCNCLAFSMAALGSLHSHSSIARVGWFHFSHKTLAFTVCRLWAEYWEMIPHRHFWLHFSLRIRSGKRYFYVRFYFLRMSKIYFGNWLLKAIANGILTYRYF